MDDDEKTNDLVILLNTQTTLENIRFMKPLEDCFSGSEIKFTVSLCKHMQPYISQQYFYELLILLDECKTMLDSDRADEEGPVCHETIRHIKHIKNMLCAHVNSKNYSADAIVSMLNMIDYLDIQWLQEPLLKALLIVLIALSHKKCERIRDELLHNLKQIYHQKLKQLLLECYFDPLANKEDLDDEGFDEIVQQLLALQECNLQKTFNKLYMKNKSTCIIL